MCARSCYLSQCDLVVTIVQTNMLPCMIQAHNRVIAQE